MKIRTIRTFDELEAFHRLLANQYPEYTHPRLATTYYGVFDVGDESMGHAEGKHLVAGAAITIDKWDLLDTEMPDVQVILEHIIVSQSRRLNGIGTALMNAIVDMYCDREIQLAISSRDDVNRLTRFYNRFGFAHAFGGPPHDKIMSRPKGSWDSAEEAEEAAYWCHEWRTNAANRRWGKYKDGIDLSHFIVS